MSYTKEEREEIARNIREFMKQPKKEKFETCYYEGLSMLHRREHNISWYDREWLETIAQDVEGKIIQG